MVYFLYAAMQQEIENNLAVCLIKIAKVCCLSIVWPAACMQLYGSAV